MKLREVADQVVIDPRKITHYALNPNHEEGKHKARVFESALGYNLTNYQPLLNQIVSLALDAEVEFNRLNEYGQFFQANFTIEGIAGQRVPLFISWRIPPDTREAHLVTLFIPR